MKVKMCGLYRPEDIDYANEVQPDYDGLRILIHEYPNCPDSR